MKPPTYEQDGFEAVDQWAMLNVPEWETPSRVMRYRGQPEIKRLQLLAANMLNGMILYRALATRLQAEASRPAITVDDELVRARACVKRLRAMLSVEREERARTMAVLAAFRQARDEEPSANPASIFEKIFNPR